MLLRRISEHLKKQSWLAVGLDLAVVVVGVVLGFQVTEWNESRQRQAREDAALARLHEEAVEVVTYLRRLVSQFDELVAAEDRAMASLSDGSWPQADPALLERGLNGLLFYPTVAPARSVYDELLGSGVFADISSNEIRASVAAYYSELDFIQGQLDYFRAGAESDRQAIGASGAVRSVYDPGSNGRQRVEYEFQMLADDPFLLGTAVGQLRNHIVFQGYRRNLLERAEAMLAELEQSAGLR